MKEKSCFVMVLALCLTLCACGTSFSGQTPAEAVLSCAKACVLAYSTTPTESEANLSNISISPDEETGTYTVTGTAALPDSLGNIENTEFYGRFSVRYLEDEQHYVAAPLYTLYGTQAETALAFEAHLPQDLREYASTANIPGSPHLVIWDIRIRENPAKCTVSGTLEFWDGETFLQSAQYQGVYQYSVSCGSYSFITEYRHFD